MYGGDTRQVRLHGLGLLAVQQDQIIHAIGRCLSEDFLELIDLRFVGRHDQLAAALMPNPSRSAVVVQHLLALYTKLRFE